MQVFESVGAATASSGGTTITAGSANTKGSWTQLIASTGESGSWIGVSFGHSPNGSDVLLDIGIGGAGSEKVILANLCTSEWATTEISDYYFPIRVPSGSRVAARCQSTFASDTVRCSAVVGAGTAKTPSPLNVVTTYGANTADSGGTSVDPGGSANTKGSYSQITSATTAPVSAILVGFPGQDNHARTLARFLVDIAVGAAASEKIVVPNLAVVTETNNTPRPNPYGPIPCQIASGSRIAARMQSSITDATDRIFDVIVYGIS